MLICAHFCLVVEELTVLSPLSKQNIHVTVGIDDVSKITCSGEQSRDGHTVTWNHPFLL